MFRQAGFMINKLGGNWPFYVPLVNAINKMKELSPFLDNIIFYNDYDFRTAAPMCACLHDKEVWTFDGPVVATNLVAAAKLLHATRPPKKYFYVIDLEWTNSVYGYNDLVNIYQNDNLELIAKSDEDAELITNLWKEPKYVIQDCNPDQFVKILNED